MLQTADLETWENPDGGKIVKKITERSQAGLSFRFWFKCEFYDQSIRVTLIIGRSSRNWEFCCIECDSRNES